MKREKEYPFLSIVNDLHTKAMHLSDEADYANRQKEAEEKIQRLYLEAYQYERIAAMSLFNEHEIEPSRSVLFRSAASLLLCLPDLTKEYYHEAEYMIACGLAAKPQPEIAVELREVWQQLQQKYQQQRWKKEFLSQKHPFEEMGVFTMINAKTLEFEFQTYSGVDVKGAYPIELERKIKTVSLKDGYTIKGKICENSQLAFLSDVIGVGVMA